MFSSVDFGERRATIMNSTAGKPEPMIVRLLVLMGLASPRTLSSACSRTRQLSSPRQASHTEIWVLCRAVIGSASCPVSQNIASQNILTVWHRSRPRQFSPDCLARFAYYRIS